MTLSHTARWFALGLTVAIACGSNDEHPGPVSSSGGAAASGGNGQPSGGSRATGGLDAAGGDATANAGQTNEGGGATGGGGGEAGSVEVPGGGVPSFEPPTCDALDAFGESELVAVGDDGDLRLLSITPDELTIAYALETSDGTALLVADRPSADDDFPAGEAVTVPDDLEFSEGATLAADGRALVLPRKDQRGFAELDRKARDRVFGSDVNDARFQRVNIDALMSGWQCGFPLLSADDQSLYFVRTLGASLVMLSTLEPAGEFASALAIDEYTLGGSEQGRKLLSGLAADERTIFIYDEATEHSAALTRSRPGGPFYDPVDFGARRGLAPNADCTALYSSERVAGKWQLVRQRRAP